MTFRQTKKVPCSAKMSEKWAAFRDGMKDAAVAFTAPNSVGIPFPPNVYFEHLPGASEEISAVLSRFPTGSELFVRAIGGHLIQVEYEVWLPVGVKA